MTCTINGNTNGPCPEYSFDPNTNRITNSGFSYDAAGDLTSDSQHTYQWDGEGRLKSVDGGSSNTITYNALGQWMSWQTGSSPQYAYSPAGDDVGYFDPGSGAWLDALVPFNGRNLAAYPGSYWGNAMGFEHVNALGSSTMGTRYDGAVTGDTLAYPWGKPWGTQGQFAGFPDVDDMIDADFGRARQYSFDRGRWLSPDPLGGNVADPQSLNRYSYALNNPTTLTDPLGLDGGNPLCGNLYDWPGGSYEGSAPSEDCGLDSYPFIPPTFPPIGVIIGGATSAAPPAPNPASPSSTGGEEFRPQPIPCVNVSALAAALTIQLAAALGVPPSSITLTPAGSKGEAADFNVAVAGGINPANLPYVNHSPEIPVVHPGENSQFWFPAPKDSVPGLGHTVHVLFNQGAVSPATGLPTISNVQVHVDIGNPMTSTGSINPLGLALHGVADIAAMNILRVIEGAGCPVKFQ